MAHKKVLNKGIERVVIKTMKNKKYILQTYQLKKYPIKMNMIH